MNQVTSLKKGTLENVPTLWSICFCCPEPHCVNNLVQCGQKEFTSAPELPAASVAARNCGRTLQCNPAWSFSSLQLSLGSAIRSIHRTFCICYRKALHLHFASNYSKTLAVITNIKRRYIIFLCYSSRCVYGISRLLSRNLNIKIYRTIIFARCFVWV
jgi:hypothetical protein